MNSEYSARCGLNAGTPLACTLPSQHKGPCEQYIFCQCCGYRLARFGVPVDDGEFELCSQCERE